MRRRYFRELLVNMDINEGDIITMKKKHPCGSPDWKVMRTGADFRLKCTGCGHEMMMSRNLVEKNLKNCLHF